MKGRKGYQYRVPSCVLCIDDPQSRRLPVDKCSQSSYTMRPQFWSRVVQEISGPQWSNYQHLGIFLPVRKPYENFKREIELI